MAPSAYGGVMRGLGRGVLRLALGYAVTNMYDDAHVLGRRRDLLGPFVAAILPDGSRLHSAIRRGTLTVQAGRFLEAVVAAGLNILRSGATQALRNK